VLRKTTCHLGPGGGCTRPEGGRAGEGGAGLEKVAPEGRAGPEGGSCRGPSPGRAGRPEKEKTNCFFTNRWYLRVITPELHDWVCFEEF
jgi:hypothetical protein